MAGNALTDSPGLTTDAKTSFSATDIVRAVVYPIASLKLTVFLLVLAVFVTWIITLEQVSLDIWALKNKHFNNLFLVVPVQTFFPPNWYADGPDLSTKLMTIGLLGLVAGLIAKLICASLANLKVDLSFPNRLMVFLLVSFAIGAVAWMGRFVVPSGLTIIGAMLINLTAAHVLRFKVQASGVRLIVGLIVLIASGYLTWLIIFNYQDDQGFGGQPPIPWTTMWKYLQVTVLGLAIASVYAVIALPKERAIERIVYVIFGIIFFALLIISVVKGEEAFIGDSAMRILWQLALSTISAMAVLVGCILLFKRKAGIVLLHLGIAGLLVNELFVTITNEEHRVTVEEGKVTHHADDLRETEFVVIDRSNEEFDRMTVIPGSVLEESKDQIDDERLPFKIRVLEYYKNSDVLRVGPHAENKADKGIGLRYVAVSQKPSAGADANAGADQASAYIEIIDRESNEDLGKYMVSQAAYARQLVDTVTIDDKNYQIGLRFKTLYPPYSIALTDTQADYYVGTETPRWFSSEFVIDDPENKIESTQKISMNNPLRYRDQTFYQTVYVEDIDPDMPGDQELSGIQVVRNSGWMIPYVCCMFVVVGLVAQFQQTLISHLSKNAKKSSENASSQNENGLKFWYPTIFLVGICALYYGGQFSKSISPILTKAKGSEIRLDLLGKLPVTFDGRVQPLDSYARNLARQLSNREEVIDEFDNKQPAIRWFADMMFDAKGAYEYQILRVENDKVQNALEFPKRKGLKYTFGELRDSNKKLIELLIEADKLPKEQKGSFHRGLAEVFEKSRQLIATQTAFWGTEGRYTDGDRLERLQFAANLADTAYQVREKRPVMPFCVPTTDEKHPWMPLSIAIEHLWLNKIAEKHGCKNNLELANAILDDEIEEMKPEFVKQKIIADLMRYEEIVEGLAAKFELSDPKELAKVLERNWHQIPRRLYEDEEKDAIEYVESQLNEWRFRKDEAMSGLLNELRFETGNLKFDSKIVDNLMGLKAAYTDGDAKSFNQILTSHLASLDSAKPHEYNKTAIKQEITYNSFSPFYVSICLYVFAFVLTIISWMGFQLPLNRAAFWMIVLALVIHCVGIIMRVAISGRPPITNLYTSYIVVSAGCVFILLIVEYATKMGIGNLLAATSGFGAVLYAWTLSIGQGDTFTVLRAVLDTQFWLTTHVIIINLGYSATLVAGMIGLALLFFMFAGKSLSKERSRQFVNIIYGTVCFALLFSFFGTVLGGLWADDSWGRFWGWDPKENGALMIVLWNAVVLHARWAGIVKDRGIAALAAIGNIIVIWSWEGVNQLGVGLHAYADSSGTGSSQQFYEDPLFYMKAFVLVSFVVAMVAMIVPENWMRKAEKNIA